MSESSTPLSCSSRPLEMIGPVWRAVRHARPMPDAAKHSGLARLGRALAETRSDRRSWLEHTLRVYGALVGGAAATAEPALERLGTRARLNRAVTLTALGRWRTAKADFDVLYAIGPEKFAEVVKSARVRSDGGYEPTDVAIAILANVSPDNEQHDRAFATKLLEHQSKGASSLLQRLNARAALLTGKRD